jgi:hypothetical protein
VTTATAVRGTRPPWLRFALVALDLLLPVALFYALRAVGVGAYLALLAGALASLVSAGLTLLRERRLNGVAAFMTTMLLLSTAVSLIGGSTRFLLAREAWLTGAAGVWFIASCWLAPRPLAYVFARPMAEGRFRWPRDWEARWHEAPRWRRMWRVSSLAWGVGTLLDAVLRWVMAYSLPVDLVPLLTQVLFAVTAIVLIVATNVYYVLSGAMNWDSPLYDRADALRTRTASSWRPPPRPPSGSRSASS